MLICPLCRRPLFLKGTAYRCEGGHSFDCARSGYVHLLPAGRKHAKTPGDNRLMVEARHRFLDKGYYRPLADTVCQLATGRLKSMGRTQPAVLDAGCGEGYYTSLLYDALCAQGMAPKMVGVDISKIAADKAARRNKAVTCAVASVFHLPIADESCDLLCNLFAPYCAEEYRRILRRGGCMLLAIPGELHLWELKQAVYDRPYKNQVKDYALEGFTLEQRVEVSGMLHLTEAEDIENLFKMTPYYYKTGREEQQRLLELTKLTTRMAFEVLLYRRS